MDSSEPNGNLVGASGSTASGSMDSLELVVRFRFKNASELERFITSPEFQALKRRAPQKWWKSVERPRGGVRQ